MASDVPVLLSDGQVRLDPCSDPSADPSPDSSADPSADQPAASTSAATSGASEASEKSTLCWSVHRLGSTDPVGTVCLAADPSPHRRRLTIAWAEGVDSERATASDVQTMSQAVRLACQWAFNSEGVVVVAWLGPTSAGLRTVMHQAGFRIHPLPWRAALDDAGTPRDAWYADLASGDSPEPAGVTLTAREQHVLAHMARGRSNVEIAEQLGISQNTVKNHVRSILEHLQAPSRTAAVVMALQAGLVSLDRPDPTPSR